MDTRAENAYVLHDLQKRLSRYRDGSGEPHPTDTQSCIRGCTLGYRNAAREYTFMVLPASRLWGRTAYHYVNELHG